MPIGRVVILVENLPVPLDRRIWNEALALAKAGWHVTVIGPRGSGTMRRLRETINGIDVLRYPQRAATGLAGYLAEYLPSLIFTGLWLLWARLHGRIHVLHAANPPDLFWIYGRLLRRLDGTRFVYDQHEPSPELAVTKFGGRGLRAKLLRSVTERLERSSYLTADLVLTVNDAVKALAMERGRLQPDDVVVLWNAPERDEHRRLSAGVEPEGMRCGYVGVMGKHDGLDLLLDAWAAVVARPGFADAVLELVGDGEARSQLEKQAMRLGLDERVRFHGYLQPAQFVPILARCRVGVCPDPPTPFNRVATMVKVIDYLTIGRPVIGFDLAETRRIAGEAGVIVTDAKASALASALIDMLSSPQRAAEMGRAGMARVDALDLSWRTSARRLVACYARLVPTATPGIEGTRNGRGAGTDAPDGSVAGRRETGTRIEPRELRDP